MDVGTLGVMIPIIFIIGIVVIVVYLRKYENQERMSMIDKGVDPQFFNVKGPGSSTGPLRISLLFIGAGLGILLGYFLDRTFDMEEVGYFSMIFIFGGIGLGASYLIEEKKIKEEKADRGIK